MVRQLRKNIIPLMHTYLSKLTVPVKNGFCIFPVNSTRHITVVEDVYINDSHGDVSVVSLLIFLCFVHLLSTLLIISIPARAHKTCQQNMYYRYTCMASTISIEHIFQSCLACRHEIYSTTNPKHMMHFWLLWFVVLK